MRVFHHVFLKMRSLRWSINLNLPSCEKRTGNAVQLPLNKLSGCLIAIVELNTLTCWFNRRIISTATEAGIRLLNSILFSGI